MKHHSKINYSKINPFVGETGCETWKEGCQLLVTIFVTILTLGIRTRQVNLFLQLCRRPRQARCLSWLGCATHNDELGVRAKHKKAFGKENNISKLTVEWKDPREEVLSVWERSKSWWWTWRKGRRNKERRMQMTCHHWCSWWRHWKWPHPQYLDIALDKVSWQGEGRKQL